MAWRAILAVGIGNALAFYDFLCFSFFSLQIAHCFFPAGGNAGLLYTLATFGAGFLTRPLGGVLIGRYGDRAGRKPAMVLAFALMGFAICGMALTPGYARIGVAAPVLLVFFRMLQGAALGGELGPSTAFLIELAPPSRRGFYVAMQWATQDFAVLVAGIVGEVLATLLSPAQLDDWGWRLAFLAGAGVVPLGFMMRKSLPETFHGGAAQAEAKSAGHTGWRFLACGFVLLSAIGVGNYVLVYMATFGQDSLGLAARVAFGATMIGGAVQCMADFGGGLAADRFGRRPVLLVTTGLLCLVAMPAFWAMAHWHNAMALYGATAVMSLLVSGMCGSALVSLTEALPAAQRSGMVSILYAVAMAVFGGTTQFVVKALLAATGSVLAPSAYLALIAGCGVVAVALMRETRPGGRVF